MSMGSIGGKVILPKSPFRGLKGLDQSSHFLIEYLVSYLMW